MTTLHFTVVIEPDEGQFHAYVPALPGCHSFGPTIDAAQRNIAEAIGLFVEGMQQDGEPIPIEAEPLIVMRLAVPIAA